LFFIKNLLRYYAEKILRLNTTFFRGDYRVKRVDDRRVLNGIFYVLRTGIPWRDLPSQYGPYTTVYNRFNRWSKAGIWDRVMDAAIDAHNGDVVMIDGTSVRVHHAAATLKKTIRSDVWAGPEVG